MTGTKVCVLAGRTGAEEFSLLEKYARQGCAIAIMEKNKKMGEMLKEELQKLYDIPVFFFHGDSHSEEDREIFFAAVNEMYGGADFIICQNN